MDSGNSCTRQPYRIEHSSSQFGLARILFEAYIIEREHRDPDSVRLALEISEQGGNSARKCSVRFGTVRGCTVRGAQSEEDVHPLARRWQDDLYRGARVKRITLFKPT